MSTMISSPPSEGPEPLRVDSGRTEFARWFLRTETRLPPHDAEASEKAEEACERGGSGAARVAAIPHAGAVVLATCMCRPVAAWKAFRAFQPTFHRSWSMSDEITMLFSGIVTLSTTAYAGLTVFLLRETRKMRKAQTEPKIDVTYRVREEWIAHLDIIVKNIGPGAAHDIRFRAEPCSEDPETPALIHELMEINFIRSGMNYLSPGQQASSFFTNLAENSADKMHCAFKVIVSYASAEGKDYEDEYTIDLSELVGLRSIGEPPLHKISMALEALQQDVHELVSQEPAPRRPRAGRHVES